MSRECEAGEAVADRHQTQRQDPLIREGAAHQLTLTHSMNQDSDSNVPDHMSSPPAPRTAFDRVLGMDVM